MNAPPWTADFSRHRTEQRVQKLWMVWASEGDSTLQRALSGTAELWCIWRSSLGQVMARCMENVPRRKSTDQMGSQSPKSCLISRSVQMHHTEGGTGVCFLVYSRAKNDARQWHTLVAPGGVISNALVRWVLHIMSRVIVPVDHSKRCVWSPEKIEISISASTNLSVSQMLVWNES